MKNSVGSSAPSTMSSSWKSSRSARLSGLASRLKTYSVDAFICATYSRSGIRFAATPSEGTRNAGEVRLSNTLNSCLDRSCKAFVEQAEGLVLTVRGVGDVRNAHLNGTVPLEENSLVRPDAVRLPVVKQPLNQRRLVGAEGAGADPASVAAEGCAADQAVGEFAEQRVHPVAALVLRVLSDSGVGGGRFPLPLPAACREWVRRAAAVPWLALRVRTPLAGLQLLHQLDVGGNRNQ